MIRSPISSEERLKNRVSELEDHLSRLTVTVMHLMGAVYASPAVEDRLEGLEDNMLKSAEFNLMVAEVLEDQDESIGCLECDVNTLFQV